VSRYRYLLVALAGVALSATGAAAQATRRVTGVVTATGTNEPLSSASVQVVGTTTGTYTNEQGRFTLTVPAGSQQIRFRRIGYIAKVVPVTGAMSEVTASLDKDVLQLETQVVTGTATVVSSQNAANAVSVVSGEQLNRVPAATIDQKLQGKIAGAVISQNSGAPGGGSQIQLRGVSTINASFNPLYVVDGVIMNNSTIANGLNVISQAGRGNFSSSQDQSVNRIADLNPEDIENIQVLKGPSASSIYGSKGTNGVIIITTKQGTAGKAQVDVQQRLGSYSLANKLGSRCFKSATEYSTWAVTNGFESSTTAATTAFNAGGGACHDYEQEFYGNSSLAYQTNLSVRGGSAGGTNYFIGGTVQHDNGLAANDFYNKQSLRVNLGQAIGSRITLRGNTELFHTLTQRGISGNDNAGINPITVFSSTPSFVDLRRQADGKFPQDPYGTTNPFQNADIVKTPENVYRLLGSVTGGLSIYSSDRQTLDYTVTGGVDAYGDRARVISPATSYTEQNFNGALAGTLFNSDANIVNANLNMALTHKFTQSIFSATTSGGFRQERREAEISQVTGRGVVFPTTTNIGQASQTYPSQTQSLTKDRAFFIQEELLTLSERLLLTAGVNAERTSNNGDPSKYYSYPKYSASYRVPGLPAHVDELKGRVAFGKAGNQPTAGRFTFLQTSLYEGTTAARASTIKGAPEIKPESSQEIEGGFDLTLFNSRVRFSATQYQKKVSDLLLQAPIAPSSGFTSQWVNGGGITNDGTELELQATPIDRKGFNWITSTTFSRLKGKVTSLPEGIAPFNPGVGSFSTSYGNAWIQVGESPSVIQAYNGCNIPLPASGACPAANKIAALVGDANPDFTMGFSNDFQIGPIRVSSLFDWRKGGDVVNLTNNYYDAANIAKDTLASQARYKAFRAGLPAYVEDAGFVKLREVTFGYTLPRSLAARAFRGSHDIRLEVVGRNLVTWTNYTGLDPEVSNFGNQPLGRIQDVTPYPPSRSFFFSVSTTF
jgi:TonB-linked SusC/RagA family outer membrane protein